MIKNENGDIAIRYYQTLPHVVGISGKPKIEYVFSVQHNICLSWVKPEHIDQILNIKKHCCGNNRKQVYFLAEQRHVDIWSGIRVR